MTSMLCLQTRVVRLHGMIFSEKDESLASFGSALRHQGS